MLSPLPGASAGEGLTVFAHPEAGAWVGGKDSKAWRRTGPQAWAAIDTGLPVVDWNEIAATSATDVWMAGGSGAVRRWNGTSYERRESGTRNNFEVLLARDGELWLAGEYGSVLRYAP